MWATKSLSRTLFFRHFTISRLASSDCYNCGTALPALSNRTSLFFPCECGAIQSVPKEVSYFDILKADPSVSLDTNELESNFRNLQRLLHPDKFSTRSEKERELSAENSALVNVAYQTLKKPLSRVRYILSSQGIDALSESSGTAGVDPALLMEIMELRESLEEGGKSAAELDRMTAEAQSHIDATLKALECCLAAKDTEGLAKQAIRLQYYSKLDEEIEVVRDKAPQTAASCMV